MPPSASMPLDGGCNDAPVQGVPLYAGHAEATARRADDGTNAQGSVHSATHGGDAESCSTCIHLATALPPTVQLSIRPRPLLQLSNRARHAHDGYTAARAALVAAAAHVEAARAGADAASLLFSAVVPGLRRRRAIASRRAAHGPPCRLASGASGYQYPEVRLWSRFCLNPNHNVGLRSIASTHTPCRPNEPSAAALRTAPPSATNHGCPGASPSTSMGGTRPRLFPCHSTAQHSAAQHRSSARD